MGIAPEAKSFYVLPWLGLAVEGGSRHRCVSWTPRLHLSSGPARSQRCPAEMLLSPPAAAAQMRRRERLVPRRGDRARLVATAESLVCERGAQNVTIEAVCAMAGVSPTAFHALFANRTDCLLAVFDDASEQAERAMLAAYGVADCWIDGVRGALFALLTFLDSSPRLAHFMLVDSLAGGPPMLARRSRRLEEFARALEAERPASGIDSSVPPFGSDAVVGAVAAILHARLSDDPLSRLCDLCGSLMGMIVLPYLGAVAARGELAHGLAETGAPSPGDLMCDLGGD
jgi:AcrR family transcriptional regulator